MKRSKFTEEQIIYGLKQGGTRYERIGGMPEDGHKRGNVLYLEKEIWRARDIGAEEASSVRR